MASAEEILRGVVSGVSETFGWDTANDQSTITPSQHDQPARTSPARQPQTVAPTGESAERIVSAVPNWALLAAAVVGVGVVVAMVTD